MRTLALAVSLIVFGSAAYGREVVREFTWWPEPVPAGTQALEPESLQRPFYTLKVTNAGPDRAVTRLLTLENPSVGAPAYGLEGEVRCQDVEGKAYLEMWSYIPDGGFYFSRTLGEQGGPLAVLTGTSDWRRVVLPFFTTGHGAPDRLEVNIVLPGRGTVWLTPLELVQYRQGQNPLSAAGQWWDFRKTWLAGGIAGGLIGLLGALVGVLAGAGVGRRLALTAMWAMIVIGVAGLTVGIVSLAAGQPYAVYSEFLMGGLGATVVPAALMGVVRRRYEAIELRRMHARDAV